MPILAGIPVAAELVWELADLVDDPAASTLRNCLKAGRTTFALKSPSASSPRPALLGGGI
jgi:hypothetical protein